MKTAFKIAFAAVAITAVLFSFNACTKVEKVTETTFKYTLNINQDFTIPAGAAGGTGTFEQKVPTTDIQAALQQNGIQLDKIKSIKVKGARLNVTTPANGNFNEYTSAEAYIAKSDGTGSVKIGSKSPIPQNVNELSLDMNTDADFVSYFKASEFSFSAKFTRNAVPADEKKVKASLDLEVLYQIL